MSAILLIACNEKEEVKKDYVTFSGEITNKNSDSIVISNRKQGFKKVIKVNEDGTFSDTLAVTTDLFSFYDGGEGTQLFLKNGFDLQMTLDTEQFDETIKYLGEGSESNNFLAEKALLTEKLFDFDIEGLNMEGLDKKFAAIETQLNEYVDSKTTLDTMLTNNAKKGIANSIKSNKGYLGNLIMLKENLPKGAVSPTFEGYENHAGGTTSLADLKGKYVYIDVWATWCGPCKAEIPFLKEVEKDYHDKNIAFVSISIDREKDHQKWIDMVNDKQLSGVQLFADSDWTSKFVEDYYIKGIPRFIMVDPDGNVITPDAPRPSSPKLRTMLDEMI